MAYVKVVSGSIEAVTERIGEPQLVEFDKSLHMNYVPTIMDLDGELNDIQSGYETLTRVKNKDSGKKVSYEEYADQLIEGSWKVFMFLLGAECIGYIHINNRSQYVDTLYIASFIITEKYTGRGYGKRMMTMLIDKMKRKGSTLAISTSFKNKAAVRLYQSVGFDIEGLFMIRKV